ncbi:MAG: DUF1801 domain-containing protein [Pseudomonadota bacterium]|nr:DUF1801 domain-containing protein [Pseudomonadota bacterium]
MAAAKKAAKKNSSGAPARKKTVKKTAAKKPAAKKAAPRGENKTKATAADVGAFIASVPDETRRKDAEALLALMKKVTGEKPTMWGPSIVGFGSYHYKYETGREGDMLVTGFSPRSAAVVVYIIGGVPDTDDLYKRLGKHSTGKSCLYIKRLADVDIGVLEQIVKKSVAYMRKKYPASAV